MSDVHPHLQPSVLQPSSRSRQTSAYYNSRPKEQKFVHTSPPRQTPQFSHSWNQTGPQYPSFYFSRRNVNSHIFNSRSFWSNIYSSNTFNYFRTNGHPARPFHAEAPSLNCGQAGVMMPFGWYQVVLAYPLLQYQSCYYEIHQNQVIHSPLNYNVEEVSQYQQRNRHSNSIQGEITNQFCQTNHFQSLYSEIYVQAVQCHQQHYYIDNGVIVGGVIASGLPEMTWSQFNVAPHCTDNVQNFPLDISMHSAEQINHLVSYYNSPQTFQSSSEPTLDNVSQNGQHSSFSSMDPKSQNQHWKLKNMKLVDSTLNSTTNSSTCTAIQNKNIMGSEEGNDRNREEHEKKGSSFGKKNNEGDGNIEDVINVNVYVGDSLTGNTDRDIKKTETDSRNAKRYIGRVKECKCYFYNIERKDSMMKKIKRVNVTIKTNEREKSEINSLMKFIVNDAKINLMLFYKCEDKKRNKSKVKKAKNVSSFLKSRNLVKRYQRCWYDILVTVLGRSSCKILHQTIASGGIKKKYSDNILVKVSNVSPSYLHLENYFRKKHNLHNYKFLFDRKGIFFFMGIRTGNYELTFTENRTEGNEPYSKKTNATDQLFDEVKNFSMFSPYSFSSEVDQSIHWSAELVQSIKKIWDE